MKLGRKALVFSVAGLLILGAGILGMGAKAYWGEGSGNGNGLAQRIAEKFNLSQDDVQGVMNQFQNEQRAQVQEQQNQRLEDLVSQGKLTEDQKNALIAKRQEMQNEQQNMQNLSAEERQQLRDQHRQEMDQWMKDNGIDHDALRLGMGPRGGK